MYCEFFHAYILMLMQLTTRIKQSFCALFEEIKMDLCIIQNREELINYLCEFFHFSNLLFIAD